MTDERWKPTATIENLRLRSEITWRIRQFFREHDVLEVHPPILGHDTVVDVHIDPVRVVASSLEPDDCTVTSPVQRGPGEDFLYLQTSPEFSMKRMLAANMPSIYSIGPVFRAGERGTNHNPEFTMVEWYCVGDGLDAGLRFLSDLVQAAIACKPAAVVTYQQAFQQYANCDPLSASMAELFHLATSAQLGVDEGWSDDRDAWLDLIFSLLVQPRLGRNGPTIVSHFPASQSALAKISATDPRTAERFELFIDGIELANGYHELLDANELIQRNRLASTKRVALGKSALPIESHLTRAMQAGMPECCGCALGLDRLIMVATQSPTIDAVIAFPIERA